MNRTFNAYNLPELLTSTKTNQKDLAIQKIKSTKTNIYPEVLKPTDFKYYQCLKIPEPLIPTMHSAYSRYENLNLKL